MKEFWLIFISLMLCLFFFHVIGIEGRLDIQNAHLATLCRLQEKAVSHQLYGEQKVRINWSLPLELPPVAEREGR